MHNWLKKNSMNIPWIWFSSNGFMLKNPCNQKCGPNLKLNVFNHGTIKCPPMLVLWWFCLKSNPPLVMNPQFSLKEVLKMMKFLSIFTWSLVLGINHHWWLCNLVNQLSPSYKTNYVIWTICCLLDFLQL